MIQDLTPELCDRYGDALSVLEPGLKSFGGQSSFLGQAVTIKAFEDNSLVREFVSQPGQGRVLVVDGGASMRRAMLGDMLAEKALNNGWQAILIHGCIRDCEAISQMPIAVFALGTHPMKTEKLGAGQSQVPVTVQGCLIKPDDWVAGDPNGVVTSASSLVIE